MVLLGFPESMSGYEGVMYAVGVMVMHGIITSVGFPESLFPAYLGVCRKTGGLLHLSFIVGLRGCRGSSGSGTYGPLALTLTLSLTPPFRCDEHLTVTPPIFSE